MFKRTLTVVAASLFSINAFAAFVGPGAITLKTTTAKEALALDDDSKVVLQGSLIKQTSNEHYQFKDESGEIAVEIDDKDLRDITVTPEDKIRITGEVDKEWTETKVDVDHLELLK